MTEMLAEKEKKVGKEASAVHWKEEEHIYPQEELVRQANMNALEIYERFSEENYPECFEEYADIFSWDRYWKILDDSNPRLLRNIMP